MLHSICVFLEIHNILSLMQAFWYKLNLYLTDSEFLKCLERTATLFSKNLKKSSPLTLALVCSLWLPLKAIYYPNFRFIKAAVVKRDVLLTSNIPLVQPPLKRESRKAALTWVTFGGAHRGVMVFGRCPDWGVFFGGGIYGRDSLSFTVCYWDWSLLP